MGPREVCGLALTIKIKTSSDKIYVIKTILSYFYFCVCEILNEKIKLLYSVLHFVIKKCWDLEQL